MANDQTPTVVKREAILTAWLKRVGAKLLWSEAVPGVGVLSAYLINGQVAVVAYFKDGNGWDLYVSASSSNKVAETLEAAADRLGVQGCRGLVEEHPYE